MKWIAYGWAEKSLEMVQHTNVELLKWNQIAIYITWNLHMVNWFYIFAKKRNAYKHVLLHRGFESFHPIFGCVLNEVRNVAQSTKFGVQCNWTQTRYNWIATKKYEFQWTFTALENGSREMKWESFATTCLCVGRRAWFSTEQSPAIAAISNWRNGDKESRHCIEMKGDFHILCNQTQPCPSIDLISNGVFVFGLRGKKNVAIIANSIQHTNHFNYSKCIL